MPATKASRRRSQVEAKQRDQQNVVLQSLPKEQQDRFRAVSKAKKQQKHAKKSSTKDAKNPPLFASPTFEDHCPLPKQLSFRRPSESVVLSPLSPSPQSKQSIQKLRLGNKAPDLSDAMFELPKGNTEPVKQSSKPLLLRVIASGKSGRLLELPSGFRLHGRHDSTKMPAIEKQVNKKPRLRGVASTMPNLLEVPSDTRLLAVPARPSAAAAISLGATGVQADSILVTKARVQKQSPVPGQPKEELGPMYVDLLPMEEVKPTSTNGTSKTKRRRITLPGCIQGSRFCRRPDEEEEEAEEEESDSLDQPVIESKYFQSSEGAENGEESSKPSPAKKRWKHDSIDINELEDPVLSDDDKDADRVFNFSESKGRRITIATKNDLQDPSRGESDAGM